MAKTAQDVLRLIKDEGIELIDLKFADLHGKWQHLTVHTDLVEEESFTEGLAFDGSSIRGWKAINESDMAMVPDPDTAWIDPFYSHKTLSLICSIQEPRSGQPYGRCPRALAQKALNYLNSTGLADTAFFGPEPEFFVFDDVRYNSSPGSSFYSVDSIEAPWNTARLEEGGNLAYKIQLKEGYFPVAPNYFVGIIYCFIGIALVGLGSTFYITCGLGPGPRDGLMTAIHNKTGIRVGRVRLAIEATVLVLGALLGGRIGLGTALFALFIGQSIAISLGVVSRFTSK